MATVDPVARRRGHFEAGHPGHRDVEDDHIGQQPRGGLQRIEAIRNGPDDLMIAAERLRRALEDRGVIVGEQRASPFRQCAACSRTG
jgi:hypothetical protein